MNSRLPRGERRRVTALGLMEKKLKTEDIFYEEKLKKKGYINKMGSIYINCYEFITEFSNSHTLHS